MFDINTYDLSDLPNHHQQVSYLHKDVDCYSAHNLDQTTLSFANRNSSIDGLFVNLPS